MLLNNILHPRDFKLHSSTMILRCRANNLQQDISNSNRFGRQGGWVEGRQGQIPVFVVGLLGKMTEVLMAESAMSRQPDVGAGPSARTPYYVCGLWGAGV